MGKNATITIKTIFEKANTSAIVNQIKKDKEAIEKAGTTNVPVNFDFNNKDFNAALQNLNKGLTAKNMAGLDFSKQMMEVIQLMSSPNMAIEEKTSEINKIAESFKLISSSKGGFITAQDRELFKQMNSNQLSRVMEEIAKIRDEEVRNTKLKEQNDIYKYSKYYDLGNGDEKVGSNFYNALLKGKVYDRIEGKEEADPLIPKTKLKPQRTTIGAFGTDLGINYNKALERALSEHREDLSAEDIAKSKGVIEKRIKEYGTIIRRIEETFETFNDLHEKTDFESMTKKAGLIKRMGALYSIAEEQEKNLKKLDNKANANGAIGIDETKFFTKAEEGEFADIRKNIISTIGSNSLNRKDITALFNDVRKEIQDTFLSEDTPELAAAKQHYRDFISTYAKTTVARVTTAAAEILDGELASASNKQVTPDASSQTGQAVQSIEKPIEEAIPKIDLVHSTNLKKEDIEIDDPKELIKQINDISAELDKSLYPTKGKPTAPSQELLYKYKALIGRAEYLNDKLSKQGISSFDKQFDEIFDKDYEYFENFFDPDKKNEIIGSAQREVMEDLYANASKNAIGPFLRKNFSPLPTDAELKKFESVQSKGEPPKESELKAEEVISTKVDEKLDKATESAEKTTEELSQMAEKLKESEENAKSLQKNLDDLGDEYSKLNEEKKKVENDLSTAQKNKDDLENKIRKVTGAGTDEDLNTLLSKIEKVDTSEKANLTQEEFDKFVDEREAFKKTKKDQAHYEKEAVKKDQAINDAQAKIEELEGQISQLKETINAGNQSRKEQLGDVAKYNSFELAKEKAIRHSKGNTEEQDFNRRQYLDEHIKEFYEHGGDINNDTHLYQLYKSGLIYHTIQEEYLNQGKVPPNYEYQGKDVTKLLIDAYEKGEEILKNKNNSVDELNKTNEVINNLRTQISDYESQIKTLKKDIEDLNKSKKALENDAKTIEKTTAPKALVKEPKKVKESTPVTVTPTSEDESVVVPARKTTTTSKTAVVHPENSQRAAVKTTVPRITSGATSGEIAAETEAVEALFQIINEVTSAVNKKTDAFKTENTTVSKVVNSEKTKLEELKTTLSEIKETLGESLAAAPTKGTAGKTVEQQAEALVKAVSSSLNKIPISFETKTALKELQTALKSERAEVKIIPDTTGFKKKIQDSVKSPIKVKVEPSVGGFTKELQKAVKATPVEIKIKPLADAFIKDIKKLAGIDTEKTTVKKTGKKKETSTVEISVKAIKAEIKTLEALSDGINKMLEKYDAKRSTELKGIVEYLTEVSTASEKAAEALTKAFSGKAIDKKAIRTALSDALNVKPIKVKVTPEVKDFLKDLNTFLEGKNIKVEIIPIVKNFNKLIAKSIPQSQRECRIQVKPNTNSLIADIKRALRKNDFSIKITGTVNEINSIRKDKQFIQKKNEEVVSAKEPKEKPSKPTMADKEFNKTLKSAIDSKFKASEEIALAQLKGDIPSTSLFAKYRASKKSVKDLMTQAKEEDKLTDEQLDNFKGYIKEKKNALRIRIAPDIEESKAVKEPEKDKTPEYESAQKTINRYYELQAQIGEKGIPQSEAQAKQLAKLKLELEEVSKAYHKLFAESDHRYIGDPFNHTNYKDSLINLDKEKQKQQKEIVETANDASAKFYSTEKVKLKDLETLIRQYERIVDNTLSEKGKLNSVEALLNDVSPKKNPAGPTKEFYREDKTYTPEGAAIANSRLKALTDLRDSYKEPNTQAKIVDEYKDSRDVIEKFRQKDSIYKMADMRKVAHEADRITKYIEANTRISAESKNKLIGHTETLQQALKGSDFSAAQLKEIQKQFYNIDVAERKAGRTGHSFFDILNTKARYLSASILSYYFSWMGIMDFFRKGFETIKEFDSALTEMQKVSNESLNTLKEYQSTSFDLGSAIGTTGLQIQQSTADWQRLGESLTEASKSAQASNILFNVSEFSSIDEATQSLVAMSSAYEDVSKNIDKMDIVDKLNQVGNDFSISTDGIATALQDSASSLKTAGDDIDESIALITAGNTVTQDPEKVGSGLRTISLRLNGTTLDKKALEEAGEDTDGMIETQSKLRKSIMAATKVASNDYKGFDIMDENGNYKSTYQKLLGLSDIWKEIKEHDKESGTNNANFILETIAGKNRSNIAASILDNPEILKNAYQESKNSKGSALRENEKQMESIEGHLTKLSNAWQKMWASASNRNTINNILNFSTAIVNLISKVGLLKTSLITAFGTSFIKGLFKGNSLVLSLAESFGKLHLALKSVIETKNVSSIFEKPKSFIESVKSGWEKYINAIKKGQAVPADKVDEAETEVADTAVKERLTIEREKVAAAAKQEAEAIGEVVATEKAETEAEVENTGANEVGNVVEEQEIANLEAETKGQLEVAAAEKIEAAAEKEGTLGNTVKNVASNVGKNATIEAGETVAETAGKTAIGTAGAEAAEGAAAGGISAGTIIAGGAIAGAAIAGIAGVYAFDKLTVSEKEAEEGAKAVMNAYSNAESTFNQHKNTISEIGDRFEQLQRGVSETGKNLTLSSGDYKEYLELSNQIADMYPDLVSGYDAQGNAIVRLKGNVDSLNDALREEQKAAANVIIHGNEETGGKSADEILEDYKHKANTTSVWDKVGGVLINNAPGGTFSESAATKAEKKLLKLLNEKGKISYAEAGKAVGDASILTYIQKNTMGIGNGNGGAYNSWTNMNKKDLQELKTFLETDIQSNQTTENESLNNLKTLLNAYAVENDSYGKLNDSSISLINSTINSITEKFAKDHKFDKGKGNKAEIINYTNELVEGVLNAQTKNPDVINALFGDAPINLKNKSLIEAQKTVDKYKKALDPYIGSYNTSILFKNLGIEDYGKEADKVQRKIKELAGNSSDDLNKLTQATKNFSYDEAEAFLEAAAGTDSASEALKKFYQLQAQNAAQTQEVVYDYKAEANAISSITDAINGSASTVGLSKDQIHNVKKKYGHLNNYDESALFEQTSKGIHLNQEELNRLNKEYEKGIKLDIVQRLKEQKSALKEVNSELKTSTGEQRDALLQQKENILNNIQAIKEQASEFDGLTSAVAKWQNATSTANEGAIYDSIKEYKTTAAELAKNQQFGTDDMRQYVGMLSGKDLSAGMATVAEVKKTYNDLKNNVIPGTKHTMMDFFTDGTTGCIDYLKTLQSINKEWASQDSKGVWKINYNSEDVAKRLGTDASVVDAMTEKLSEFMDVDMADHEKSIKDYINDVHVLDKQIKKLTGNKESVHIDIRTDNRTIPELETQLAEAKKEIKRINKLNLEPKVKDKMIVSATKKTKILIRKLAELKMPSSIKVDTSEMDKGWQDAYKALQDYWNAYYSHSQMPNDKGFSHDLEMAKAKLNDLAQKYRDGLDLKVNLKTTSSSYGDIDFNDLNKKLDKNDIKTKAENKVKTTAEFDGKEATKNLKAYKGKIDELNNTNIKPKTAVANTSTAQNNLFTLKKTIEDLPERKKIFIDTRAEVDVVDDGTPLGKLKHKSKSNSTGNRSSNHRISGNQQAGGTDNAAPGKTLVGELGQELVCRDGEYFTVGDNGPEMINLHRGDIVFNADQTKDLLKKGQTSTLGKSLASGNVQGLSLASGNNTGSGAIVDTHSSASLDTEKKNTKKKGKKSKEKKSKEKEKKTAEFFDWIETRISRIERRITNVSKIAEQAYRSISTREKKYKKELKLLAEQRKTEKKASAYYFKRANSVKLSKDYKKKVREGKIEIESIKDDKLKEKINRYKELYENGLKAKDAIAELNDTIQQTKTAILEMRISLLNTKKSIAESKQTARNDKFENAGTYGWNGEKAINNHYAQLKKTYKEQLNYSKQTVSTYIKERKLVKKGSTAYAELTQKIYDARQEQNKLNISIKNIPIDRLTAQFERINKLYEAKSNSIQQKLSLLKADSEIEQALGHRLTEHYYKSTNKHISSEKKNTKAQLDEINKIIAKATKENEDHPSFFKSEKYLAYIQQRNQLETQYLDYQKQEIDNNNALRQLEWDRFDRIQDMIEDVNKESSFLADTISNERQLYNQYTGKGNRYEQAVMGLHVASYETYKARSKQYKEEIQSLKSQLEKDPNNTTLKDRYRSLISSQQEVLSNLESEKKSLRDMVQNEYNSILSAMKKIIDAKKQELAVEKNVYDYAKNVAKQSRQIAIFQKELAAYKGDNSEENKARVQKLNQQLRDAQENLDNTEYDKMIADQNDMLDNLYNDFELYFNNQMLQDLDDIISKEFTQVNNNTKEINETVSSTASSIGYDVSTLSDVFVSGGSFDIKMDTINEHLRDILSAIEKSVKAEESDTDKSSDKFEKDNNNQDKKVNDINNNAEELTTHNKRRDSEAISAAKVETVKAKEAVSNYNNKINNAKDRVKELEDKMKGYSKSSSKYKELEKKKSSYTKAIEDMRNERDSLKKVYLAWSDLVTKMEKQKTAGSAAELFENALKQQKYKIPTALVSNGFANGGTIGKLIKSSGEDGFVLARTGEEVLSIEKIQELKKALSLTTSLSKLQENKLVGAVPNTKNFNINNNNEFVFKLNGVSDFDSFINKVQTDKRFEKIVQQMTIGTAMGDNTLSKYKY
ncbi:Phage-related minor tail protein [Lachnospiraceae bacterium KHCPX20]|nr:Phage-related minor tail protein [Lachnospiraceae bacterium KHCPX20]